MFTGIVEAVGIVSSVETNGTNAIFWIESSMGQELKIDQSISHSGVCLTVDALGNKAHRVTAVAETLLKTNLNLWQKQTLVNLERCMQMNGRIDGHIVQGHVDATAVCTYVKNLNGSWEYRFVFEEQFASLLIEKGSVCVNGISLTAYNVSKNEFTVSIIPYTYEYTNIKEVKKDSVVNIEWDMIGKYINRIYLLQQNP